MTHRPNPNPSPPTMLSFLLLLLGLVSYITGAAVQRYAWVFQLICLAAITASLFLLIRWRMTWFVFSVSPRDHRHVPTNWHNDDDPIGCPAVHGGVPVHPAQNPYPFLSPEQLDFIVVKGQGSRPGVMECVLGMDSLVQAWPVCRREEDDSALPPYQPQKIRQQYPGVKLYEYTQTFRWDAAIVTVFRDGAGYAALLLDIPPEAPLAQYLLTAPRNPVKEM